ncbi:hypothetical protein KAR10_10020, partial [bacterium]|nr:hypothetical protein [bacterium]
KVAEINKRYVFKVLEDLVEKGVLGNPGRRIKYSFIKAEGIKDHFLAKVDKINEARESKNRKETALWEKIILLPVLLIPMLLIHAWVLAGGETAWLGSYLATGWDYWDFFAATAMLLSGIVVKRDGDTRPGENENTYEKIKNEKPGINLIKNIAKACEGNEKTENYIRPVIENLVQLIPYDNLTKTMQSKNDREKWALFLDAMDKNVVFRNMVEHLDGMAKDKGLQQPDRRIFARNGNELTGKIEKMYGEKFGEEIPEGYLTHLTKLAVAKMQEPPPGGMVLNDRNEGVMRLIEKRIQERYQCYIDWRSELEIMATERVPMGRDGMRELIMELKDKKHEEHLGRVIITDPVADILLRKLDKVPEEASMRELGNAGQEGLGEISSSFYPGSSKMKEPVAFLNTPLLQRLGPVLRIFPGLHARIMLIRAGILACLLRHSFIVAWLNQRALHLNREAYLKARFKHDGRQYGSVFCSLLINPNDDLNQLTRNKNITSIPEFQEKMLIVLIDVLRDHEVDLSLLQDVIRFMNYVTPGATRKAGKINGKSFRMPDLLYKSVKRSNYGFIVNYFREFPGNIIQYQEPSSPLQRRIIRIAEQAA